MGVTGAALPCVCEIGASTLSFIRLCIEFSFFVEFYTIYLARHNGGRTIRSR